LSPFLHFGHVSAHEAAATVLARAGWSPARLADKANGKREGWWGIDAASEAFLDELVTWRELGFNFCRLRPDDYDRYESLPPWARRTLEEHVGDRREHVYGLDQLLAADTHDPLWNAAQRELRDEGRMHNYLRMLWGKKVMEWSATPRDALAALIELNNRFALDGRDPNSYSGIFWCLGRFDRPWAPERSVFGQIRYMSSANTARKFSVKAYLARHRA
jgi:deoxyribodipyrimidine photo-lyase